MHPLGLKGATALEARGLCLETIARFGVYTASWTDDGVRPDADGTILAFPFYERDVVVAEKYRAPGKKFSQRKGGRRTFWNSDVLDDPLLEAGTQALIITEGEIDGLTAIDCGFPMTVSVPDGAPAVQDGDDPEALPDIDPEQDATGKFEYVFNNRDRLKRIKRFVIASDTDKPGKRLAAELVRRLGAARCAYIVYPEGCKDLNDVLMRHGRDMVATVLNTAKPYPLKGVYRLADYPPIPPLRTFLTGWDTLDTYLRPFLGELMVVTGIPNHGKSTWVTNLLVNLAEKYRWRSALFSPEMPVVSQYRDKLRKIRLRHSPETAAEARDADQWINDRFRFIDSSPIEDFGEDVDLNWVLDRATDAVIRDGVQALVIDPWNELDHAKRKDESMHDYIGRAIRQLKRFAKERQVMVIIVAHPTKEVGREGKGRMPTPYDVDGSAHWFNKPDHIVIVHRPDEASDKSIIRIAKVRFEESGSKGYVTMRFNTLNSRYDLLSAGADEL